jgi:hypothetical protein
MKLLGSEAAFIEDDGGAEGVGDAGEAVEIVGAQGLLDGREGMVQCLQVLDARVGIAPQVVGVHPDPDPSSPAPEPAELVPVPGQVTRELELEVTNA